MSKSLKNVVNPDDVTSRYGADSLRLYEMFLGPLDATKPWDDKGVKGVFGFLTRAHRFFANLENIREGEEDPEMMKMLHQTIKKVEHDIEYLHFNTSISQLMILTNLAMKRGSVVKKTAETFCLMLSPFAPHLGEELWQLYGNMKSLAYEPFPKYEEKFLEEDNFEYPVSFNGKMRFKIELPLEMPKEEMEKKVLEHEVAQKWLQGNAPKKIIIVPGKIINVVI
jgi:leucyl-tRNA synthetase